MNIDRSILNTLLPRSTTASVMSRASAHGRSSWALRVKGQMIVVGDKGYALRLYDMALDMGVVPTLLNNGRVKDRSKQ